MLMDQAGDKGGAGAAGDKGNPGAGGAGAGDDAANQKPGTSKGAGEEQYDITVNGVVEKITLAEMKNRSQQFANNTQKEQENAKIKKENQETRKSLASKLSQADEIFAELEAKKNNGEAFTLEDDDKLQKALDRVSSLENKNQQRELDKALTPVKVKFPNVNEHLLLKEFSSKVNNGEIDGTPKELMEVAEAMSKDYNGKLSSSIDATLKDGNNPTTKKHNADVIKDYIANKKKYAYVFEDEGGQGGSGAGNKPINSIADAAEKSLLD